MPGFSRKRKFVRVQLVAQTRVSVLEELLHENKFQIVEKDPDFIVCYGGDGTALYSERKFPGIPKLLIKKSKVCRQYDYIFPQARSILSKIREGKFRIQSEIKLTTELQKEKLVALNEIQIHTKLPIYAIRFSLSVNGKAFQNLIGDGVIVATPFGSTGYYTATGGKRFTKGIGISFNNLSDRKIRSFVVPSRSIIDIQMTRGPAWLLADNSEKFLELNAEDEFQIRKSDNPAYFIYVS